MKKAIKLLHQLKENSIKRITQNLGPIIDEIENYYSQIFSSSFNFSYSYYYKSVIEYYNTIDRCLVNSFNMIYLDKPKENSLSTHRFYNNPQLKTFIELLIKENRGLFTYPSGNGRNPTYMVIGINPSTANRKNGDILRPTLFLSKSGFYVRRGLNLLYQKDKSVTFYITNIKKGDGEITKKDLDILKKEISLVKPKYIIALGKEVHKNLNKRKINHILVRHPGYYVRLNNLVSFFDHLVTSVNKVL